VFNIGPLELIVLAFVGLVVLGPDRVPGLARDAGRLLRTLREVATGARTQLRDELGPEFSDIDLRSLNPRTAITQALLGDDLAGTGSSISGKSAWQRALLGDPAGAAEPATAAGEPETKPVSQPAEGPAARPLGRGEAAPFDADAT
jgi:sec-independent protein translocase protein TatB